MPVSRCQHDPADTETPQPCKELRCAGAQCVGHNNVTGQLAIDCHRDERRARTEDSSLMVNGTDPLGDELHPTSHYAATAYQSRKALSGDFNHLVWHHQFNAAFAG